MFVAFPLWVKFSKPTLNGLLIFVVAGEVEHGGVEWKGVGTVRGIIVTNKIQHYCNNH